MYRCGVYGGSHLLQLLFRSMLVTFAGGCIVCRMKLDSLPHLDWMELYHMTLRKVEQMSQCSLRAMVAGG